MYVHVCYFSATYSATNNFSHNLSTEISNENETSVLSFLIQFEPVLLQDCLQTSTFVYVTPFVLAGVLVVRRSIMSLTTNFQWLLNAFNLKNILQWKM